MTRLIVSTNRREAPFSEPSGWIFIIDLESGEILQKTSGLEPPYRILDENPRGGMRGMRGLSFFNGELAAADYSAIFFFDKHWNLVRSITHPSMSGIHELIYDKTGVWVTSTANDMLVRFDMDGSLSEIHNLREQAEVMRRVKGPRNMLLRRGDVLSGKRDFRKRTYFTSDKYDRLHLNGLTRSPDGRLVVSLGLVVGDTFEFLMKIKTLMRFINVWDVFLAANRAIRRLLGLRKKMLSELVLQPEQGRSAIISMDSAGKWDLHLQFPVTHNPSHSIRILEDGTGLYLNSSYGRLVRFKMDGEILMDEKVTDEFLRGLLVLPGHRVVMGASNTLVIYDLKARQILNKIELTNDPKNAVFDIQFFPDGFDLPPASLQEKIGTVIGFEGRNILWEERPGAHSGSHP